MILLIDNYDSFSYNLYQLIGSLAGEMEVVRNDALTVEEIAAKCPEAIILSPGPGRPEDAGVTVEVIQKLGGKIPLLGVCLGEQAMCLALGGKVGYAKALMHGKQSLAKLDTESVLFRGLPEEVAVARYHSLAAIEETLPEELRVTARTTARLWQSNTRASRCTVCSFIRSPYSRRRARRWSKIFCGRQRSSHERIPKGELGL